MKYIITESRRDKIIQNFLEDHVGNLTRHLSLGYDWKDKNGETIFNTDYYEDLLGINQKLWNTIKTMFNLTPNETETAFLEFFHSQTGRYFPDGIYTFEVA